MTDNDIAFGDWLRRHRRGLDLTQQEPAQRVGCGVTTIRKIETGERRPSKELAAQMAVCLNITPEEYDNFSPLPASTGLPPRLPKLVPSIPQLSLPTRRPCRFSWPKIHPR